MSFWATSTGENVAEAAPTEYSSGGGGFENIPDNSDVLAAITKAEWTTNDGGDRYITLEWTVEKPVEVENRKVWQKLWVKDDDPNAANEAKAAAKRDKALRMLATIDANCGGRLAKKGSEPTSDELALALSGRSMVIKCMEWEMNGATGNWIAAVSPPSKELSLGKPAKKASAPSGGSASGGSYADLDDDIPF